MSELPFVSIIMPIHNEREFIARSLQAVLGQDYPSQQMEVVIADGMSTDGTREEIERIAAESREVPVTIVDNSRRLAAAGMNVGLERARGAVIVRLDGHTIMARDYVSECVAALERSGADNVGGCMVPVGQSYLGRAVALATSSRFGVGGARFRHADGEEWADTVYLGCWPRNVFHRIGLFDEGQVRNQDDEFNYRLISRGGRILLCPKIQSRYYNRDTLRALSRQYFDYGLWKVRVMQKHLPQMRLRHFVPPLFVGAVLGSLSLSPFSVVARWTFVTIVACYLLASWWAAARAASRDSWRLFPLLPFVFAALHLAYGTGFLCGLFRFCHCWAAPTSPSAKPAPSEVQEVGRA